MSKCQLPLWNILKVTVLPLSKVDTIHSGYRKGFVRDLTINDGKIKKGLRPVETILTIPIIIILAGHPVAIISQGEGVMICVGWGK